MVEALTGRKSVLPTEVEEELVRYCLVMELEYYGFCAKDVKRVALQLGCKEWSKTSLFKRERDSGAKMAQAVSQGTP
jgi:hypothetical protein